MGLAVDAYGYKHCTSSKGTAMAAFTLHGTARGCRGCAWVRQIITREGPVALKPAWGSISAGQLHTKLEMPLFNALRCLLLVHVTVYRSAEPHTPPIFERAQAPPPDALHACDDQLAPIIGAACNDSRLQTLGELPNSFLQRTGRV